MVAGGLEGYAAPMVDVYEDKDDIVVKAELPGLAKEDIEINLTDHQLTVKGEKAKASFKDGLLEIRVPKTEEAKKKQIKVKVD